MSTPELTEDANPWREAVLGACTTLHLGCDESDPAGSLKQLIEVHVEIAADPRVSSTAAASQKQRHTLQSALESIARGLMPDPAATAQRALVDSGLWNADPRVQALQEMAEEAEALGLYDQPIPNADPAVSVSVGGCVSGGAE